MNKVASKLNKKVKSKKSKQIKIKMRKPIAPRRKARTHKAAKKIQQK